MLKKLMSIMLCAFMLTAFFVYEVPRDEGIQVIEDFTTRYIEPENEMDFNNDITIDSLENGYVTGNGPITDTSSEYGTLKDMGIPFSNQPPIAHAGLDQTAYVGEIVQFDGSGSYDPDGDFIFDTNIKINDDGIGFRQYYPRITVDKEDNVHVVWEDNRDLGLSSYEIYYSKSIDGGYSFLSNVRVNDNTSGNQGIPVITVNENLTILVAWSDDRDWEDYLHPCGVYFARSTDFGLSFEPSIKVNDYPGALTVNADAIDICSYGNDSIFIIWEDTRNINTTRIDIYCCNSTDVGVSFGTNVKVSDDVPDFLEFSPSMDLGQDGTIYTMWKGHLSGQFNRSILFSKSTDAGNSFENNTLVEEEHNWGSAPSVAVDTEGNIDFVWSDYVNSDMDVYFARSTDDGNTFSTKVRVNEDLPTTQTEPDIAINSFGDIYVVWKDWRSGDGEIYFSYSTDGGVSFRKNLKVNDVTTRNIGNPSIAVDSYGNPHIVWWDYRNENNGDIYYSHGLHILSYDWNFGDSSPHGDSMRPTHVYSSPGVYTVTLTVMDSSGAIDSDTCIVTVLSAGEPPVADAGPFQTVNEGDVVQFDGSNSKGSTSSAEQVWTKYVGNPVLDLGPSGSWDDAYVTHPSVLYDGTTYHMWYSGYDSSNWRIGYAHSTDGITWIKNPSNPIIDVGASGSWEDTHVTHPIVLYDGTKYHMWYSGHDGWTYRIGYASSSDGIAWVKYSGNPVLDCGPSGSWEDTHVTHPTVLYDGTKYHMWYTSHDGSRYRIGYAYSSDGINWLKSAANPVFNLGSSGSWDDFHVYGPSIIYNGITYSMWYSGHDGSNWRIGYATSSDGITWTRDGSNPVLDIGPPGSWEDVGVHSPTVLFSGGSYHMWYRGFSGTNVRIGYAYSSAGGEAQIVSYEWDFEGDGIYDYVETPSNAPDGAFDGKTIHIYGDNGLFKVTLRVTDDIGLNDTNICNVTVNNVAPMVEPITAQGATSIAQDVIKKWVARYNGPGFGDDVANSIALDSSGNVYVTGFSYSSYNPNNQNYTTIKYDSNGNELWVAIYEGPGNSNDDPHDIAVDSYGNVYVTGQSEGSAGDYDYATIKYDTNGNELWVARYNTPVTGDDYGRAIAVDISGNVYVTGYTRNGYTTIKYDSNGNEIWIVTYYGGMALDIAVGSSGNVYVTGYCHGGVNKSDFATVAYNPAGNELWVARYNGPGNSWDHAYDIALDSSGNVYVSGSSYGNGTNEDYAIVKYDSSGNELWIARYNGPANKADYPQRIALDLSGNVYVTGRSRDSLTNDDYATVAYDQEGNELWVARYNGPGNNSDSARAMAINDLLGIIYVTGRSHGNGTDGDYATVAYDLSGNELWVTRYNGPGNKDDLALDVTVDLSGNVYVTGYSRANETVRDYATIKYSSSANFESYEGSSITFTTSAIDQGSDDLTFTWQWGDGTPDTETTYYNDNTGPEPVYNPATNEIKSPGGIYPFNVTDIAGHTYGDNGVYNVTLTIEDDDGGVTTYPITIKVNNVEPTIESFGPFTINESSPINITGIASDPGSDDLTFTWTFEYGPTITNEYYNDGAGPDPYPSPGGIFPFSATDTASHTYGDNGVFTVILTVEDDDGGISVYKTNITVSNINPTVTIESLTMDVEIGLRVAGRKYNNVSMTLYEEGNPIGYVSIERMPGSPNDQMAWIPITLDMTRTYSAIVTFTPEDPPNVGGNPVWIYIKFQNGSLEKIHHTFNVQQSKKRDSDHWNHVEPWEVNINAHLIGYNFEITSYITDPGSDDDILTFIYGSQAKTVIYLNNPPNTDPFPSPEVKPVDIIDNTTLIYEGPGTLTLLVEDDDGGTATTTIDLS